MQGPRVIRYNSAQHAKYKSSLLATYKSDVANLANVYPWFSAFEGTAEQTVDMIERDALTGDLLLVVDREVVVCGLLYFIGRPGLEQNDDPERCFIRESLVLPLLLDASFGKNHYGGSTSRMRPS